MPIAITKMLESSNDRTARARLRCSNNARRAITVLWLIGISLGLAGRWLLMSFHYQPFMRRTAIVSRAPLPW